MCKQRQAPFWGFLQSLRCSFLPEKEKQHWTIHCCIVIEWLKLFQTTLKSERWRYGEKFSGDFCTWLPMICHGVMWSIKNYIWHQFHRLKISYFYTRTQKFPPSYINSYIACTNSPINKYAFHVILLGKNLPCFD